MSRIMNDLIEEVVIEVEQKEEEPQEEQPSSIPIVALLNYAFCQQLMANAAANQNVSAALPEYVSAALPSIMSHFQYNQQSIEVIRQFHQRNEDAQSGLVPPSDNSTSPELIERQVGLYEPKSKRSRQRRKEFPIERGETGQRKRRNVDSVLAKMMQKAANTEVPTATTSHAASITTINEFKREATHKYETVINTIRSLAEDIKRINFAPLMGQVEKISGLADEVDRQFQMWKDIIPHAEHSCHRHRMSSEDQGVLNTLLAHYKADHPEQFNQVLTTVAQLYDKQERIVMNNFRRAQAKEREMTNDRQSAATRNSLCTSDEGDGNRTAEGSGNKDDSVTASDFSSMLSLATLDASSTTTDSPSSSEQSATESSDQLNPALEIQSIIAAVKQGDPASKEKILETVFQMVNTHANLVQIVAKLL